MIEQRLLITFGKTSDGRYYSHHDLMRCFSRAVRKAGLPVRMTEGFNPRHRIIFVHALGLGIGSDCEEAIIEMSTRVSPEVALRGLQEATQSTVEIYTCTEIGKKEAKRQISATSYSITGWKDASLLRSALDLLTATDSIDVIRKTKKGEVELDIRPYVGRFELKEDVLIIEIMHLEGKSARSDEICGWLAEHTGDLFQDLTVHKIRMTIAENQ